MATISDAIQSLRPGVEWTLTGDDVTAIEWVATEGVQPLTVAEVSAEVARLEATEGLRAANTDTLHAQATTALAQNRAAIAAAAPTNAQVIAQVKNLSAQNNALIRLVLGLLDATD
jgi:hypothetical protein